MAKDPAFLFYPGDWLSGTMGMSFEEKGAYMELLIYQFNRGPFEEKQALRILNEDIWQTLKDKFIKNKDEKYFNQRLELEKEKRSSYVESRRNSRLKTDEDKVRIYIVRDNVRTTYKIGTSVNPLRRYNELSKQKAPAIIDGEPDERSLTLVWYSEIVKRTEEKKLHIRFDNQRIKGEWFALTNDDLDWILNKYKGQRMSERTLSRTENRNENEIVNENEYIGGVGENLNPREYLNSASGKHNTTLIHKNSSLPKIDFDHLVEQFILSREEDVGKHEYTNPKQIIAGLQKYINSAARNYHDRKKSTTTGNGKRDKLAEWYNE
jgi:hypothetical protein